MYTVLDHALGNCTLLMVNINVVRSPPNLLIANFLAILCQQGYIIFGGGYNSRSHSEMKGKLARYSDIITKAKKLNLNTGSMSKNKTFYCFRQRIQNKSDD